MENQMTSLEQQGKDILEAVDHNQVCPYITDSVAAAVKAYVDVMPRTGLSRICYHFVGQVLRHEVKQA
jgi:hypothetical protein